MTSAQKWVLGLASLASFMISLDSLVVSTALSTIRTDLHASIATLEWTVTAYNLTFAALLLTGSALGDRFGRRAMFISGLALFTVASGACALSQNIGTLIAMRAVQGAGAALVMPLALAQLTAVFPSARRGRVLGIFSGVTGLATFSGPFIGGAVTQGIAWQWIFWINLPLGAVAIALSARRIAESTGPNGRFDLPGVILVTAGVFGLVWGLVRGNSIGWGGVEVVGAMVAGGIATIAFTLWEARTPAPMLPMRFFRVRAFTTANLSNLALFSSLYGTTFMLAQFLQVSLRDGPLGAGLRLMPWTGMLMLCAPMAGAKADQYGERVFMVAGLTLNAVGLAWLAAVARADVSYADMLAPLVLSGCGLSMAIPAAGKSVAGAVRLQEIGQASGAISMLRIFGGVFGVAVLGAVFATKGGYTSPTAFADGFSPALRVAASISAVGALIGLGMPGRQVRPGPVAQSAVSAENGIATGTRGVS